MKIVEQTPTKLIIKDFPVLLWLCVGPFMGVSATILVVLLFTMSVLTLTCKRVEPTQGTCQLLKSGLFESQVREIPLNTLKQAEFKRYRRENVGPKSQTQTDEEVVLLTKTGEKIVLFTDSYSGRDISSLQSERASIINAFLKNPNQKSLKLNDYPVGQLFGSFLGSFVFIISLSGLQPIVTCIFDKSLGHIVLKKTGLRGKKVTEELIDNILNVTLEKSRCRNGFTYWVVLVFKSEKRVPLTSYMVGGSQMPKTAESISEFLNIPLSSKSL